MAAVRGVRRGSLRAAGAANGLNCGPRFGRFGWPEDARLRYYDEDGNRISEEEWRELGGRRAEKRKRAKAAG
jgi:hypothetical protein